MKDGPAGRLGQRFDPGPTLHRLSRAATGLLREAKGKEIRVERGSGLQIRELAPTSFMRVARNDIGHGAIHAAGSAAQGSFVSRLRKT